MNATACSGEVTLWRAVIQQAIGDATLGLLHVQHKGRVRAIANHPDAEHLVRLRQARTWLSGMGRDFRLVCHLALLDPLAVMAAGGRTIAAFDQAFPHVASRPARPAATASTQPESEAVSRNRARRTVQVRKSGGRWRFEPRLTN